MFQVVSSIAVACWGVFVAWLSLPTTATFGHGAPIFVQVHGETNQVVDPTGYDSAVLDGSFTADRPSLQVLGPFSGVPVDGTVSLRVTQPLLFSNSDQLESHDAELSVVSAHFTDIATATAETGLLDPIRWTEYPGGTAWDADGLYLLGPGAPARGVYGLVVQVLVDGAIPSEPFLIPVVNNPDDLETSLAAVRAGIISLPQPDFNADWLVNELDLQRWQDHYGTTDAVRVFGDADGDGHNAGSDFLSWQRKFQNASLPSSIASGGVPEPTSSGLALFALFVLCSLPHSRYRKT